MRSKLDRAIEGAFWTVTTLAWVWFAWMLA